MNIGSLLCSLRKLPLIFIPHSFEKYKYSTTKILFIFTKDNQNLSRGSLVANFVYQSISPSDAILKAG